MQRKLKILLVDDEEGIHLFFTELFEEDFYLYEKEFSSNNSLKCYSAYNGPEALDLLIPISPDLVILDINMPGMNGVETLRRIKMTHPKLPVIFCSAYQEYKQDIGTWASEAYVVKSANLSELASVVAKILNEIDKYKN